jgi:hypothetical protein
VKQISVVLTDDQYAYAKSKGRLWLREVVQAFMDEKMLILYQPPKKKWWRW